MASSLPPRSPDASSGRLGPKVPSDGELTCDALDDLAALDPKLILAHHHDDFLRPIEGDMGFSLNVNLGAFADDVAAAAPGLPVRTLDPLQTVSAAGV